MEGQRSLNKQCPLLRPAVSPVSGKASVVIEPALDCDKEAFSPGCGVRVFDGDKSGKLMTLDIAGTCLATCDAVTAACAGKYCKTGDHAADCPVYPEECRLVAGRADQYQFPLPLGVPLKPEVVIKAIGARGGSALPGLVNNFPRNVSIRTRDGREIVSTLVHVYYSGQGLLDGILYFSDRVRGDGVANDQYLLGNEIGSITFL